MPFDTEFELEITRTGGRIPLVTYELRSLFRFRDIKSRFQSDCFRAKRVGKVHKSKVGLKR